MAILDNLGMSKDSFDNATGEAAKEFKSLPAGAYAATIKQVLVYTNNFGDKSMQYVVNVTEHDRDVRFMKDINSKLKGDEENGGYSNRFKQFLFASKTEEGACSIKEKAAKINSFGKEYECDEIIGMKDKKVIALVLLMDDINKADGAAYKMQNVLSSVVALDGTDSSGENKVEEFTARVEKTPVTPYEGYVKPGKATAGTVNADAAEQAKASGF